LGDVFKRTGRSVMDELVQRRVTPFADRMGKADRALLEKK